MSGSDTRAVGRVFGCFLGVMSVTHFTGRPIYLELGNAKRHVVSMLVSDTRAAGRVSGCCYGVMSVTHFAGRPIYLKFITVRDVYLFL